MPSAVQIPLTRRILWYRRPLPPGERRFSFIRLTSYRLNSYNQGNMNMIHCTLISRHICRKSRPKKAPALEMTAFP